jgi:preprotein translocase subunit SecE
MAIREKISSSVHFLKDVRQELRKVNWPGRKELINLTLVVIVATLIVSFFLGVVDYGLSQGVQQLLDITW